MMTSADHLMSSADNVRAQVRAQRKAKGLLLKDLSATLEANGYPMSVGTLSKLEAGTRTVTVDDLAALARALGTTPEILMRWVNDPAANREIVSEAVTDLLAASLKEMLHLVTEMPATALAQLQALSPEDRDERIAQAATTFTRVSRTKLASSRSEDRQVDPPKPTISDWFQ